MWRRLETWRGVAAALALALAAAHAPAARAQGPGGSHSLYGDLKVDESKAGGLVPLSFNLILKTESGTTVDRQSVMPNGRYRFGSLRAGSYDIVIEVEAREVARVRVELTSMAKNDFRHDIELAWSAQPAAPPRKGTTSPADFYERTASGQEMFDKAAAAISKKKFEEAAALLQKVVEADAKDYQAWTQLGTMRYATGKPEEAEAAYARALAERPDFLTAAVNLGRVRISRKDYDKAIEVLGPAVERHPQSADANHQLGEAYLQSRKGSKAVVHLNEALRLDPDGKADLHLRLAALYNAAGYKDLAAAEYEQFLKKRPQHPDRRKLEQYVAENKKK
jgi:tetratricopeptide (TPR) repeat protein